MRRRTSDIHRFPLLTAAALLAATLAPRPIAAQPASEWVCIDTSGPSRQGMGCAYDSRRGKLVVFGGGAPGGVSRETWEWDGESWTKVDSTGPSARAGVVMVYDEARGASVVFGGWYPDWNHDETWIWDGDTWHQMSVAGPSRRSSYAACYDRGRQKVVLFGGGHYQSMYNDTWEWDGDSWRLCSTQGPCQRLQSCMTYDSRRGKCVLFGGQSHYNGTRLHDTWEWDGDSWVLADTGGPEARVGHSMAYDSVRGRTVLFGGADQFYATRYFDDTWEWDGDTWVLISDTGPSACIHSELVYHNRLNRVLLYGGSDEDTIFGDLWIYPGFDHNVAAESILAPAGVVKPDTTVTPMAVVRNRGLYADSFRVMLRIGPTYADTAFVTLQPAEVDTVYLAPWHATQRGTFVVACSTMLDGDQYTRNDKKTGTVTVSSGGLEIHSITPNHGGDIGWVTVDIEGTGFDSGAVARLVRTGQPSVGMDTGWAVKDSSRLSTAFRLNEVQPGSWNMVVANATGDSAVFFDGFSVETGTIQTWVDVIGRNQIRLGRDEPYRIRCADAGNTDVCVALKVEVPQGAEIVLPESTLALGGWKHASVGVPGIGSASLQGGTVVGFMGYLPHGTPPTNIVVVVRANQQVSPMFVKAGLLCMPLPTPPFPPPLPPPRPADPFVGWGYGRVATVFRENGFDIDGDPPSLWDVLEDAFLDLFKPKLQAEFKTTYEVGDSITRYVVDNADELGVNFPDPQQVLSQKPPEIEAEFNGDFEIEEEAVETVQVVQSRDPNDKAGPTGFGIAGYVPPYEQFQYVVYFENVDTATAPAEDIVITDTLDTDLDWTTFVADTSSHAISSTSFDSTTGVVTWRFDDINLPPNHNPPEGEGWLSYTINPKPDLPTGTEIRNRAWIVFDVNEPMATRHVLNTIDAGPPSSNVVSMPEDQPLSSFTVQLAGADDQGGSGIKSYDVYVSDNDSAYTLWTATESATAVFTGQNGHTYKFYSIATDNVGYVEAAKTQPEATTTVQLPTGVEVSPNPFVPSRGHTVISFFGAGLAEADIKVYNKAGELVKKLTGEKDKDRLDWDAKSENGKELASGVYIYVAKEKSGTVRKGKFAIIR